MNDMKTIYKGVVSRIRSARDKGQLWKLVALHLWRIEFSIEDAQELAGARK